MFVARRYDVVARYDRRLLAAALRETDRLVEEEAYGEPVALFFCLARERQIFPSLRRIMVPRLAIGRANTLGFAVDASPAELARLRIGVALHHVGVDDVEAWFRDRMTPITSRPWPPR